MNKIMKLLVAVLLFSLLVSPAAFAHNDSGKDSLVALGDSISFGYNLEENLKKPAKKAFPYLIGEEIDLRVRNLSSSGLQTDQLLATLIFDQKYRQAVRHADYVTVTIGSNDLIEILQEAYAESGGNTEQFSLLLQQKLGASDLFTNLAAILQEIRSLTDAPIVLYNFYNPFHMENQQALHLLADQVLLQLNGQLLQLAYPCTNVFIADAFGAFGDNQAAYLLPGDVHPSIAGQEVLAAIGINALGLD